ncbi:MAG TPA: MFS transporter, partial [Saprospiraceae bacterium]|nr:MFS transporter [Saprospiraceae bacterium]
VTSTRQFLRLFTSVMLPMFMAAIDQTLLATATPIIAAELGGLRDTSWIAVAYLLAAAATTPMYGRFGDRFGRRNSLLVALGNEKVYGTANPFPWMDMISIQGKTNFFEKRVGDYQKAGVMAKREEQVFTTDAEF